MSGLEVNKILASIVVAILVVTIIGHIGDLIIDTENNKLSETAYKIEIEEDQKKLLETIKTEAVIEPISALLANASLENGQKIYKKCSSCHNNEKGSANKVGPNLWNIINRPKASIQGFSYSKELATFGGNWNYEELSKFLYKPKNYIKGNKMNFGGIKKANDRADLIFFLREKSDNPTPLP